MCIYNSLKTNNLEDAYYNQTNTPISISSTKLFLEDVGGHIWSNVTTEK